MKILRVLLFVLPLGAAFRWNFDILGGHFKVPSFHDWFKANKAHHLEGSVSNRMLRSTAASLMTADDHPLSDYPLPMVEGEHFSD